MAELHDLTALEQAGAVRRREISPAELVEHHLARLDRRNDELGAFVTVTGDAARQQAEEAEARVTAEDPALLPPLFGVPIAIKDLNLTAGVRTTLGSRVYEQFVPPVDDHVVELLRRAGTIPAATAAPAPPLDPPADRLGSHGVRAGGATTGSV